MISIDDPDRRYRDKKLNDRGEDAAYDTGHIPPRACKWLVVGDEYRMVFTRNRGSTNSQRDRWYVRPSRLAELRDKVAKGFKVLVVLIDENLKPRGTFPYPSQVRQGKDGREHIIFIDNNSIPCPPSKLKLRPVRSARTKSGTDRGLLTSES